MCTIFNQKNNKFVMMKSRCKKSYSHNLSTELSQLMIGGDICATYPHVLQS